MVTTAYNHFVPVEILDLILRYLEDTSDLYRCVLVSRLWACEAINILWGRKYSCHDTTLYNLVEIESISRKQYYAERICHLDFTLCDFDDAGSYHRELAPLSFPRLSGLILGPWWESHQENLLQYLQPRLRSLEILAHEFDHDFWMYSYERPYFEYVSADFFNQLRLRCPSLSKLSIEKPCTKDDADRLMDFLRRMCTLKSLYIESGNYCDICDFEEGEPRAAWIYLLTRLAELPTLRKLVWAMKISKEIWYQTQTSIPNAFSSLQKFKYGPRYNRTQLIPVIDNVPEPQALSLNADIPEPSIAQEEEDIDCIIPRFLFNLGSGL